MKITFASLFLALLISLGSALSIAQNVFREDVPERYVVQKGDTLWDISNAFLTIPWYWPEIWHINQQIENPHLIFPGDVLKLVYIDGEKRVTVDRTLRLTPSAYSDASDGKLGPKLRVTPLEDAIPAIPLDQINSWLLRNRIVEEGELENAPYIISGQEGRIILGSGDMLFARGTFANNIPNYGMYRQGDTYIDPVTNEVLGVQAIDLGGASMRALDEDIATLSVVRSIGAARPGDRLLPTGERAIESTFFPSQPIEDIDGLIISVEKGVTQVGMLDVVAINKGDRDQLEPGNVLSIFKRGKVVRDRFTPNRKDRVVTLPEQKAGLMMVFQTFEKMSLALVLKADRGIKVGDHVRKPE